MTVLLIDLLQKHQIDLIVLAGFMTIISDRVIDAYRNKIINVHPSLIPAFCGEGFYGLRVHEAALQRGVKLTGATIHFVNEVCDGGPIILQKAVTVSPRRYGADFAKNALWKKPNGNCCLRRFLCFAKANLK